MLSIKAGMLMLLLSVALNGAGSCEARKRSGAPGSNQPANTNAPVNRGPAETGAGDELKPLAQGQHSSIRNAFIFVARDTQTYAELRKIVTNLPELEQNFFMSKAVVAAFLGERRTGGYGVRFSRAGNDSLRIEETRPAKDAITTQVITYPFAVMAAPVGDAQSLTLDVGDAWSAMTRAFQVSDGEFTMSGGIAGRSESFGIKGSLGLMREGNLATIFFNLQSSRSDKARLLKDVASGVVHEDESLAIQHLGAGSFVDMPADALRATGSFKGKESRLSLRFESIPGKIADGFNGRGALNAAASEPAPQKRTASTEDSPR